MRLGAFAQITGVDIAPEQTERATDLAKEAGLDDALSFHVADARQALREAEGRCDVVLALNSLHHLGHPEETMRLIARALRPGGQRAARSAPAAAADPGRRPDQAPGGPPEPALDVAG